MPILLLPLMMLGMAAAPVAAADEPLPTIFDLPLDQPVVLPECSRGGMGRLYSDTQQTSCQVPAGAESSSRPNNGAIIFTATKAPWFLNSNRVETIVIDGKLEGMVALTKPVGAVTGLAMDLINKFGVPTQNGYDPVEPGRLPTLRMVWDRPGYTVEYVAPPSLRNPGTLTVETAKARAARLGGNPADGERARL